MTSSFLPTVTTVYDARQVLFGWRERGETVVLVPTMGALHRGHLALVAEARKMAKRTIVSIFVNPTQFAPSDDLASYPRALEADQMLLTEAGCDLLFAPTAADMYPDGFASVVDPGPLAEKLEGVFRPGHFKGVATIVAKLLLQTMPDAAIFGQKDYQQLLVIRRVARDLDIPIHIIGGATVRDEDGLALSSRNVYLSADERRRASLLPQVLFETADALRKGSDIRSRLEGARERLIEGGFRVDYLVLADASTLEPLSHLVSPARLLVAARLGKTRLIDNVAVDRE